MIYFSAPNSHLFGNDFRQINFEILNSAQAWDKKGRLQ